MQLRLGMTWWHHNLSSNFMAVILRKFTFCHIINLLIYLEMKFESGSRLISFMLPPPWTVNKCYITFTQLSPMVLNLFFSVSAEVLNCYIFLYSRWIHVKNLNCNKQNKHTNGFLFLKPQSNDRQTWQKKKKNQCPSVLKYLTHTDKARAFCLLCMPLKYISCKGIYMLFFLPIFIQKLNLLYNPCCTFEKCSVGPWYISPVI